MMLYDTKSQTKSSHYSKKLFNFRRLSGPSSWEEPVKDEEMDQTKEETGKDRDMSQRRGT